MIHYPAVHICWNAYKIGSNVKTSTLQIPEALWCVYFKNGLLVICIRRELFSINVIESNVSSGNATHHGREYLHQCPSLYIYIVQNALRCISCTLAGLQL